MRVTLNTASANGTDGPRVARDASVEVENVGTHSTTVGSIFDGTFTTRPAPVATMPPKIDAATLSAWPSSSVAIANHSHRTAGSSAASGP